MNKEQYIKSRFRSLLSETLDERVKDIELNIKKEVPFGKGEFDYVQEGKGGICEECGGMMKEGECSECGTMKEGKGSICEECGGMMKEGECGECGYKKSEVLEKKHGRLDKLSKFEIEDLLDDVDDDIKRGKGKKSKEDSEIEFELEIDESWYSHDEYERMRDFGTEDELQAYQDKLVSGGDKNEMKEKLYGKQRNIDKNKNGKIDGEDFKMLRKQQDEEKLYEVEFEKNEFSEDSKPDFLDLDDDGNKKESMKSAAKDAKRSKHKVKESILYTESDLIDLIERLVVEEKEKVKKNISVKEPKGYREYERVHKSDKKENDNYLKSLAKKMTDYLKPVSDEGSKYEMKETKKFPTENGGLKKGIRKKYTPSDAVDDYNDAFSYPGQTNLRFDEIKPNKKNIEKYLKGHKTTGNAQVDEDGNALGNVVPSEVGEKFFKNFEENLYGQEQADASYKRYSQPVDVAGDDTEEGSLKSKKSKGNKSAQSVLNKLDESIETKKLEKLNEEYNRIQQLMGYDRKTQ
jgi:hypothetical protein